MLNMRESKIEKKVCKYATDQGWLVYKFSSPGHRGVPDRIFMRNGVMFFIEFKALGKKPTKLQEAVAERIEKQEFGVYVVDNIGFGSLIIDSYNL